MFWSKLCKSSWNCAWNLAFPVFISPIVWNMCENLHYESVYFKELHNEQEYYGPTLYRAGAAVLSTITSCNITSWFATPLAEIREKTHCNCKQSGKIRPVLWGAIDLASTTAPSSCCRGNWRLLARMLSYKIFPIMSFGITSEYTSKWYRKNIPFFCS